MLKNPTKTTEIYYEIDQNWGTTTNETSFFEILFVNRNYFSNHLADIMSEKYYRNFWISFFVALKLSYLFNL